jgi:hypothetical protein
VADKAGFFVRLNYRSPKDASHGGCSLTELYRNQLKQKEDLSGNSKLRCLFSALDKALRCSSAGQAVSLLGRSERVSKDLICHSELVGKVDLPPVVVCLRRWEDSMDGELEYRCFVREGQLRAISQYNHYVRVPPRPDTKA